MAAAIDQTNANTALAGAIAQELQRSGVRRAVICPGSRSTPQALALLREPGIETTTIVDERSAAFYALGAAAATRAPVAIVCTSGTAAANLHPAVCEAAESGQPLVVLTCDRPPELRSIGAGQTIDQIKLYGSSVRWFCELGTPAADDEGLLYVRATTCRAVAAASGDPWPGPVHVNVSWGDPLGPEPVGGTVTATSALALVGRDPDPLTILAAAPGEPPATTVERCLELIAGSSRPLLVCGRLPVAQPREAVAALAAAIGAPILAEPTSQLRFGPHDRSHVISPYDAIVRASLSKFEPDLVLRFGELPTSKALRQWLGRMGCPQLACDPAGGRWHDPARTASVITRSDPGTLAAALAAALTEAPPAPGDWLVSWQAAAMAAAAVLAEASGEPGLHRLLADAYRTGDLVYLASSLPIRDQEMFAADGDADVLFLANRGANGIDGLISSGIGAATASGRPAWIVTGDLGLHHDSNALALLGSAAVPIRLIVINNGGGGIFEQLPQAGQLGREEFDAILGTPRTVGTEALCAAHQVDYHRLTANASEFEELAGAGTCVAELVCERRQQAAGRAAIIQAAVQAISETRSKAEGVSR